MCCQESGEREATVSLLCPKAAPGEPKLRRVNNNNCSLGNCLVQFAVSPIKEKKVCYFFFFQIKRKKIHQDFHDQNFNSVSPSRGISLLSNN